MNSPDSTSTCQERYDERSSLRMNFCLSTLPILTTKNTKEA
jgi:hypothetical protein